MSVFASKGKPRFSRMKNLDFLLNANALNERVHIEGKTRDSVFNSNTLKNDLGNWGTALWR